MSFELEDSEEDFSGLDDGGYEEGALHEEIGLTLQPLPSYPVKDEYEFDLEESASASRADSPVAAPPPPPPPPPPQPPALSFSAAALARSRGAAPQSSRFKQQPERMRRSTEEAEEEEEEEDGGAMGEAGEEEEDEEEDGEFVATVQPWRQGAAAAVALPAQGWPSALSSPTQEDIAEVEDNEIEEAVEETSYNPLSGSGSGGGSPLVGGGGSHAWQQQQQQQQQREEQEQVEDASEAPPGYPLASMAAAQALLVPGARIFALYRSGEDWFEGVVKTNNGDGTWAVDYGEEDEEEAVPLARMRLGEEPALTAAAAAAAAVAQRPVSAGGSRPRMGLIPEAPELAAHLQRSPSPYTQDDFESDGESASAGGGSPLHYQQPQQQHSQAASSLSPSSPAAAAAAPLQPQPTQQPQPALPSSASTSVSSASNILPALPPGYVYQAVQLSQLEGAAQSQARAAQPAAAAPPPPPHPLIGPPNGGFHGGLMGLALALAQASPMLSIGTSSLAAVLNGSRGGAAGAGAAQATLLSALRGEAPGEQQQQQSQAGSRAPPPPLLLSTPSSSAPSAPSAAFLRALATGLQGAPPPLPPSAAGSAAAAGLHPSVVSALAQAQASLASMDTLYARQLESIREAAGRARGKLLSVRERASGFPGAGRVGASGPPGGSASPPSAAAAAAVHEPAKLPTGQQGRIPGTLSFQEALAMVRREHSAQRL